MDGFEEYNEIMQSRMLVIDTGKKLIERLMLRIHLSQSGAVKKSDFENNEMEILKIKTMYELSKFTPVIADKEKRFIESFNEYVKI